MPTEVTTSNLFSHETVTALVVEPLFAASVALSTLRTINTTATELFLPRIGLGSASFVAELDDIDDADLAPDMLQIIPKKVAALTTISNESADDANAAAIAGDALVAGLADEVDAAFFTGSGPVGPSGLPGIGDAQHVTGDPADPDAIAEAILAVEAVGGTPGAVYVSPATWLELATLKVTDDSRQPVLSAQGALDRATARALFGVPVHVTRHLDTSAAWVVDTGRTVAVVRTPFRVATSDAAVFSRDGIQLRATGRVEFASVYPTTVVEISTGS